MDKVKLDAAVELLVSAHRKRQSPDLLPPNAAPASVGDAHAIQDAVTAALGESVGGYKVAAIPGDDVARGAIFSPLIKTSPVTWPAQGATTDVEVEMAFRLMTDLPPRAELYSRAEVIRGLEACPAIEILGSRYIAGRSVAKLDRLADHFGNGGLVHGPFAADWRGLDTLHIPVRVEINGAVAAEASGGHMTGDPSLGVVALANQFRATTGLRKGLIVTTGAFTGVHKLKPGDHLRANIAGLGSVEVTVGPGSDR